MLVYFALGNAKFWRRVHCPTPAPDARYFAFWWNIGLNVISNLQPLAFDIVYMFSADIDLSQLKCFDASSNLATSYQIVLLGPFTQILSK